MTKNAPPRLAITMGDPAGVGPEIIAKLLQRSETYELCTPVVVGDRQVLEKAQDIVGRAPEPFDVVDLENVTDHVWGQVRPAFGRAAADYIEHATRLALDGRASAVVTAPINKEALRAAGVAFPGHTEMIAHLCGVNDYGMMLVGPQLRVIHVSTHVSLSEAIRRVTRERVLTTIRLGYMALRREHIEHPRIAVAGLNPHAGEGGLFGDEETLHISPAVQQALQEGIDASGPHPPDTVFVHAARGRFDLVIAMYHDQGHIPAKLAAFDSSINVTVGLPILRTSVDHGTAFDIVGTGQARDDSLLEAVRYAARIAKEDEYARG